MRLKMARECRQISVPLKVKTNILRLKSLDKFCEKETFSFVARDWCGVCREEWKAADVAVAEKCQPSGGRRLWDMLGWTSRECNFFQN